MQVRKLAPKSLRRQNKQFRCGEMTCHITCANFSRQGEIVATYNDEVMPQPSPPGRPAIIPSLQAWGVCLVLVVVFVHRLLKQCGDRQF